MTDTEALIYNFKIHTILGKDPRVCFSLEAAMDIVDEIKERDTKIAQLEREADWLAKRVVTNGYVCVLPQLTDRVCSEKFPHEVTSEDCVNCWRREARGAVSNES